MDRTTLSSAIVLLTCATALALSGCASDAAAGTPGDVLASNGQPLQLPDDTSPEPGSTETAAVLATCDPGSLATLVPTTLTVSVAATPAPPWFSDADPATGNGLASAIVKQLASRLGYSGASITWVDSDEAADIRVGPYTWTAESSQRERPPDVSVGYFAVNDALVVTASTARAVASTPHRAMRIGYVPGEQSEQTAKHFGAKESVPFASEQQGLAALTTRRIDAMLVPTTRALRLAPGTGLVAIAQVEPGGNVQADQLHLLLAPDSPLTPCVNSALDRLRVEGVLASEAARWVTLPLVRSGK